MEARDWDGARTTLADDYVCDTPDTGERLGPADSFIGANQAYPEPWAITVDEVLEFGGRVVARVRVASDETLWYCLSFADVDIAAERIVRSTDPPPDPTLPPCVAATASPLCCFGWLVDRGEEAPEWRAPFWLPEENH
jgi:hypothetical protein